MGGKFVTNWCGANLHLGLRSPLFYPLNYGSVRRVGRANAWSVGDWQAERPFSEMFLVEQFA